MGRRLRRAARVARLLPAYAALGGLKRVASLETLARWAWREGRGERDRAREWDIVADLHALWRVTPLGDRDCVQRSLLLYRELSAAGADPMLVAGFKRRDGTTEGHAWVIVDGQPAGEGTETVREFTPAVAFGRGGRKLPPPAS